MEARHWRLPSGMAPWRRSTTSGSPIDTTVQPKAVTHSTDSKLRHRGHRERWRGWHDVTLCASPVARYARQEAARLHHGGKRREAEGRKIFLSRQKRGITPTIRRELRRLTFESTDPQVGMIYHSQWHTSFIRITFLITIGWKNRNGLPPEKTFSNVIKGWHAW